MKTFCTLSFVMIFFAIQSQTINSFPHLEEFETGGGTLSSTYPDGWSSQNLGDTSSSSNVGWRMHGSAGVNGSKSLFCPGISGRDLDMWMYTPPIEFVLGETYIVEFEYRTGELNGDPAGGGPLYIHYGSMPDAAEMSTTVLWENSDIQNINYETGTFQFTAQSSDPIYFGLNIVKEGANVGFAESTFLDNFSIALGILAISDISKQLNFEVYPNPVVDGKVQIAANSVLYDSLVTMDILDSVGKRVMTTTHSKPNIELDISHLENGIYFIRILTVNNAVITKKLIVNN